ncbi:uncharacterized protein LY89DRAFT_310956 [Mollisia scopiformis]|uniref:Uncharacterized protein n=1 Tax=Mollisia scopiformis TaxID=149040 RepID=A0A194XSU6_MOLSC|nr:uncharacterized protein LY89DRAFT_310956 [Mollisia scopiformis]KUJ22802.1 hypothetical protein LY89DRAFT_310956 [Mollisia scopiformis]
MYLSFYDLENIYCPNKKDYSARLAWLKEIGLDAPLFHYRYTTLYQRQEVEDAWAQIPPHLRKYVERQAVMFKYKTTIKLDSIPLRHVPPEVLPLPISVLAMQFFNALGCNLNDVRNTMNKRRAWLKDLNLHGPLYSSLCVYLPETKAVDQLHCNSYSVIERRAIQAKAAYLRVMLNPPKPSWVDFESKYSSSPRSSPKG